jgi:glycine/D-amino acid oxidase-like deaminating enzyme
VVAHLSPYAGLSYWLSTVDGSLTPRPPLQRDLDVDVAIVGGGYTGLWTAYYLSLADPGLRVAVLDAEICGYGASGRNGGWCSALFPVRAPALARRYGRDATVALYARMRESVDEVGRVAAAEGIDCHFAKGGTVVLAWSVPQLERAWAEATEAAEYRLGVELLTAAEARERCGATSVLGGTYTPHCAAIHPARLVRGLAAAVERRGVRIYERTRVSSLEPGRAVARHGTASCRPMPSGRHEHTVRAGVVVRATEAYTARLPGRRRALAPVYSLMIATDPLPPAAWDEIGLRARETFADHRHLIIYGQRTADGRLAFGGRGAPYHFGSRIKREYDREPAVFGALRRVLVDLFPVLASVPTAAAWGGPLGVPRDWTASVGYDRGRGLAWAGGYVGDGVATSNLAGRTLADLIAGRSSELIRLPWVGHNSPRWELEPLRWLGVNAGLRLMTTADAAEERTGQPSRRAAIFGRLLGP